MEARIGRLRLGYLRPEVQSRCSSRRRVVAPPCRRSVVPAAAARRGTCPLSDNPKGQLQGAGSSRALDPEPNRQPSCTHDTAAARSQSSEATMIEPKPIALTPWTSEAVVVVTVVDCASVRRISEARVEGEWRKRGLELPSGRP